MTKAGTISMAINPHVNLFACVELTMINRRARGRQKKATSLAKGTISGQPCPLLYQDKKILKLLIAPSGTEISNTLSPCSRTVARSRL